MREIVIVKKRFFTYLFALALAFTATSCEVMNMLLAPTPTETLVRKLELDYDWRLNFARQTVEEGSITNRHYKEVRDLKIKAIFYDTNGNRMAVEEFWVSAPVTPDGVVTFKEKYSFSQKTGNIQAEIINAAD